MVRLLKAMPSLLPVVVLFGIAFLLEGNRVEDGRTRMVLATLMIPMALAIIVQASIIGRMRPGGRYRPRS